MWQSPKIYLALPHRTALLSSVRDLTITEQRPVSLSAAAESFSHSPSRPFSAAVGRDTETGNSSVFVCPPASPSPPPSALLASFSCQLLRVHKEMCEDGEQWKGSAEKLKGL